MVFLDIAESADILALAFQVTQAAESVDILVILEQLARLDLVDTAASLVLAAQLVRLDLAVIQA